eukprot:3155242-Amphidinium_carterae.1
MGGKTVSVEATRTLSTTGPSSQKRDVGCNKQQYYIFKAKHMYSSIKDMEKALSKPMQYENSSCSTI